MFLYLFPMCSVYCKFVLFLLLATWPLIQHVNEEELNRIVVVTILFFFQHINNYLKFINFTNIQCL
jgi:hypothetical protein